MFNKFTIQDDLNNVSALSAMPVHEITQMLYPMKGIISINMLRRCTSSLFSRKWAVEDSHLSTVLTRMFGEAYIGQELRTNQSAQEVRAALTNTFNNQEVVIYRDEGEAYEYCRAMNYLLEITEKETVLELSTTTCLRFPDTIFLTKVPVQDKHRTLFSDFKVKVIRCEQGDKYKAPKFLSPKLALLSTDDVLSIYDVPKLLKALTPFEGSITREMVRSQADSSYMRKWLSPSMDLKHTVLEGCCGEGIKFSPEYKTTLSHNEVRDIVTDLCYETECVALYNDELLNRQLSDYIKLIKLTGHDTLGDFEHEMSIKFPILVDLTEERRAVDSRVRTHHVAITCKK